MSGVGAAGVQHQPVSQWSGWIREAEKYFLAFVLEEWINWEKMQNKVLDKCIFLL